MIDQPALHTPLAVKMGHCWFLTLASAANSHKALLLFARQGGAGSVDVMGAFSNLQAVQASSSQGLRGKSRITLQVLLEAAA